MLNKIFFIALIFSLQLFHAPQYGQSQNLMDTPKFRFGVELGGGYGSKLRSTNYLDGNYSKSGFNISLRLKWGSGKYFGAGIETGWLQISSLKLGRAFTLIGETDIEASLNAIPVLFILGVQLYDFQVHGGAGYYNVISNSSAFGNSIISSEWDFGYLLTLGYVIPSEGAFKLGAEIKWNNITEVQVSILSLQLRLLYRVF
jgi:hypothetical protein